MKNSKWYVAIVNRTQPGFPQYQAVKVVGGEHFESQLEPTRSYVAACKRAELLNMQDQVRRVK